jgi:hypothetical protein
MLITVELMAARYHLLPSEVLSKADTFDLYAMDLGLRYEGVKEQKRNGTWKAPEKTLSEKEMKEMLTRVRSKK